MKESHSAYQFKGNQIPYVRGFLGQHPDSAEAAAKDARRKIMEECERVGEPFEEQRILRSDLQTSTKEKMGYPVATKHRIKLMSDPHPHPIVADWMKANNPGPFAIPCRNNLWYFKFHRLSGMGSYAITASKMNDPQSKKTFLYWNSTCHPIAFENRPAWLPIALLCCQIDPAKGIPFASKIMDADPSDNAPALIACDWIEETGTLARSLLINTNLYRDCFPQEWQQVQHESNPQIFSWQGPLHLWCRKFIEEHCLICGQRRKSKSIGKHHCVSSRLSFLEFPIIT